jgi:hypothetical protein
MIIDVTEGTVWCNLQRDGPCTPHSLLRIQASLEIFRFPFLFLLGERFDLQYTGDSTEIVDLSGKQGEQSDSLETYIFWFRYHYTSSVKFPIQYVSVSISLARLRAVDISITTGVAYSTAVVT